MGFVASSWATKTSYRYPSCRPGLKHTATERSILRPHRRDVSDKPPAGGMLHRAGDAHLDAERVGPVRLALADAFDLWRVPTGSRLGPRRGGPMSTGVVRRRWISRVGDAPQ